MGRVDKWQLGGIILLVHSSAAAADISLGGPMAADGEAAAEAAGRASESQGLLASQTGSSPGVIVQAKMEYQVCADSQVGSELRLGPGLYTVEFSLQTKKGVCFVASQTKAVKQPSSVLQSVAGVMAST